MRGGEFFWKEEVEGRVGARRSNHGLGQDAPATFSKFVVVDCAKRRCFLVFGDAAFEEVGFLFDVHHFGEPWEWVADGFVERSEAAGGEAAVGDVVDVGFEIDGVESKATDREAVADELFFESDAFTHGSAEVFAEILGPDVGIFVDEIHEKVPENFDVIRFVTKGVAEHLADAGEFVLTIQTQDHAEKTIELGALHDLAEHENVLRERLFVLGDREVDVAAESAGIRSDKIVFRLNRRDVLEHGLALVRVDAERGNHVNEAVCVDIFLVSVATEDQFQLGSGDDFANDVEHIITDDAFCGGEITDAHFDDPALDIADFIGAPLLDVLLHGDVFRLPMIVLHRLVEVIRPLVFQREDVEEHGFLAIDHALAGIGELGLFAVQDEGFVAERDGGGGRRKGGGHGGELAERMEFSVAE